MIARTTDPNQWRLRPTTADLVDVGFVILLAGLAVYGFRSAFGGGEELAVGIPAVIVGAGVGYLLAKLRLQLLLGAVLAVVGFFLFGGLIALRGTEGGSVLPTPDVLSGLVDGAINGWARLLSTVPPAGQAGNLLAIPYLVGYLGALLAVVAAYVWPRLPICVVPPAIVLAVSVLFGVDQPASLLLQGAVFAVGAVAWLSLRARRANPAAVGGSARRLAGAGAMLLVVGLGALVIGPILPGADSNDRYLLRDQVQPPFDPSQYPSPLARYRQYDGEQKIDGTLFTVDGVPADQVVRLAVMDDYDGYVWRASPPGTQGGTYQRVGDEIQGAKDGTPATVHFTMGALASVDSVWIPTAGSPTAIGFEGASAGELSDSFRFNRVTDTAASPRAPRSGDSWTVETRFPIQPDEARLTELPVAPGLSVDRPQGITEEITRRASDWAKDAPSPYAKVKAIIEGLKDDGAYANGADPQFQVPAGHSLARLVPFLSDSEPQGNGEQYAAGVAYLAEAIGIPARVVLEFALPPGDGPVAVTAEHVRASVEIALADMGWVRVEDPTPPKTDVPQQKAEERQPQPDAVVQPPPPTTAPPPATLPEEPLKDTSDAATDSSAEGILGTLLGVAKAVAVIAIPVAILTAPFLVIVWFKARRRKRRHSDGPPAARVAGGWAEVLDLAKDLGTSLAPRGTRRELAFALPSAAAATLATDVDTQTFGPADPTEDDADRVWGEVGNVRTEMLAPLNRRQRWRAAVSLRSLRNGS